MEAGAAEVTKYVDQPSRHRVWKLVWNSAKVDLKEGLRPEGILLDVNATVYDQDQGVTTIHADKGVAIRDSAVLSLRDHVIAKSAARDARLTCEALKWDPDRRILIATGNVRYHAGGLEAGPFPEVWASPDMERFGTPDTFAKEKAQKP